MELIGFIFLEYIAKPGFGERLDREVKTDAIKFRLA